MGWRWLSELGLRSRTWSESYSSPLPPPHHDQKRVMHDVFGTKNQYTVLGTRYWCRSHPGTVFLQIRSIPPHVIGGRWSASEALCPPRQRLPHHGSRARGGRCLVQPGGGAVHGRVRPEGGVGSPGCGGSEHRRPTETEGGEVCVARSESPTRGRHSAPLPQHCRRVPQVRMGEEEGEQ